MISKRDRLIRIFSLAGIFLIVLGSLSLYFTLFTVPSIPTSTQPMVNQPSVPEFPTHFNTSHPSPPTSDPSYPTIIGSLVVSFDQSMTFNYRTVSSMPYLLKNSDPYTYEASFTLKSDTPTLSFSQTEGKISQGESTTILVLSSEAEIYSSNLSTSFITLGGINVIATLPSDMTIGQPTAISLFITPADSQDQIPLQLQQKSDGSSTTFVMAHLNASTFTAVPLTRTKQPLYLNGAQFTWLITPRAPGSQIINIPINVLKYNGNNRLLEDSATNLLFAPNVHTQTAGSVSSPFFSIGQITLSDFLVIFLGSILNLPWFLDLLKKKGRAAQDLQKSAAPDQAIAMEATATRSSTRRKKKKSYRPRR